MKPLLSNLKIRLLNWNPQFQPSSAWNPQIVKSSGEPAVTATCLFSWIFLCELLLPCAKEGSWHVCNAVWSVTAISCASWASCKSGEECFLVTAAQVLFSLCCSLYSSSILVDCLCCRELEAVNRRLSLSDGSAVNAMEKATRSGKKKLKLFNIKQSSSTPLLPNLPSPQPCLNFVMVKYWASIIHADCVWRHFNEPVGWVASDKTSCRYSCMEAL